MQMNGSPPSFRPRAKVSATARPLSPTKPPPPPRVRATPSASTSRASSTVGRNAPSAPATPDTRTRLHHAASTASLAVAPPRLLTSRSALSLAGRASPTPRIRAKVSALASPHSPVAPSFPPPPRSTTPNPPPTLRARASSTQQAPPLFYPITTAAPAANPHRFAPPRPTPGPSAHRSPPASAAATATPRTSPVPPYQPTFQAFRAANAPSASPSASSASTAVYSQRTLRHTSPLTVKVAAGTTATPELALAVPLPHSPPASVLSLSSRSSVSLHAHSRAGSTSTSSGSRVGIGVAVPADEGAPLDTLDSLIDDHTEYTVAASGERTVKAAAKSDRKIADLEITTRSLLAINATLEATAHRQAREIRALRRRLRETRLSLPPRAFRALAAADKDAPPDGPASDDDDANAVAFSISDSDDDEEEEEEDATPGAGDAAYRRVRALLDALLIDGRAALACDAPAPTKVLSPDEMRRYHEDPPDDSVDGDAGGLPDRAQLDEAEEGETSFDDSDADGDDHAEGVYDGEPTTSEDEVEALIVPSSVFLPSSLTPPPPPIRVTQPGEL